MNTTSLETNPSYNPATESNRELDYAWRFAETTGVSIFLTGKAGTGKTTFLRNLREQSRKSMIVVAPTGVAAINAGGVTIHSFFQLPLSPYIPGTEVRDKFNFSKDKLKIIRALDLLVIDEISMVRSDLLDAIDHVLRKHRRSSEPFGGVQLLMIGDLQQLTPVVTPADEMMLKGHYDTPYFFGSHALSQVDYVTIQLTKVYRQQNPTFINLLNAIRENRVTDNDLRLLNSRLIPGFRPPAKSDYIRLTTHNAMADDYNRSQLLMLKSPQKTFNARIEGTFPEYSYPTDATLTLKTGAQVMFVRNDPAHRYYNGLIGHIEGFYEDKICVKCPGRNELIEVEPQEWENAKYSVDEKTQEIKTEVLGTFIQYPLRLAWAITIHKSQGLTFEHAVIDAGQSFSPGQVYVALSRCKTLEGMVLSTEISPRAIMSDSRVEAYISRQEAEAKRSTERLSQIENDYYRSLLTRLFDFKDIVGLQERLARLLAESYHRMFPTITRNQGDLVEDLRKSVTDVTWKWCGLIRTIPFEQLKSEAFQERIRKSAGYFINELKTKIVDKKTDVLSVKSANKNVMKRLNTLRDDLYATVGPKIKLLEKIASEGYDISKYLRFKQQSLLAREEMTEFKPRTSVKSSKNINHANAGYHHEDSAQGDNSSGTGSVRRDSARISKEHRKSEPKEPKIPSHILSYERFKEGISIAGIAQERGLKEGTIRSHLLRFVPTGEVKLEQIVAPDIIPIIEEVLGKYGDQTTVDELRPYLPEHITSTDIYAVREAYRAKRGEQ